MKAHELRPAPGSTRPRKRVGRGISAGQGKTAGRGQKGQGSRSSVSTPSNFEGGQMPLAMRLPKLRGFHNFNRKEFAVVNLGKLSRFEAGTEVNPQLLEEVGLVKKAGDGVKILAAGKISVALKVSAHRVSAGARTAIEAAGGTVELLGPQPLTAEERATRAEARAKKDSKRRAATAERAEAATVAGAPEAAAGDKQARGDAEPAGKAAGEAPTAEADKAEAAAPAPVDEAEAAAPAPVADSVDQPSAAAAAAEDAEEPAEADSADGE
ncbi:MAG: large subunit ribosomal protein [Chloroflexota bacterium]|jgi:large subunit ribosomal protein L15|nr:large subunit ribosomal protein [Chloroflexota bacterium]